MKPLTNGSRITFFALPAGPGTVIGDVETAAFEQYGGGGFPYGGWFHAGIDEATLKQMADMTGGEYHLATSANELQSVFQKLPTYLISKREVMEISVAFAAFGALLAIVAVVLSLLWHPLP